MARLPRLVMPGHPQHVIQRGNNRQPIFGADADYRFYLEKLQAACEKHHCDLHAYVLMTNHVHLLITPHDEEGLGKVMQMVGRYYVQYYNYLYQRTGTLWEGRYKASLIDSTHYLLRCMRYIELNPVRAKMVEHPRDYPWSSYGANAQGETNPLITPHLLYRQLDKNPKHRHKAYRQLFRSHLDAKTVEDIREATNKAWVLGDNRFRMKMERMMARPAVPRARGGDRKSAEYRQKTKINRD